MKQILLTGILSICMFGLFAQNGLEQVIVERYYVSDANDTMVNVDGGVLPVGSVTYRLYADMLPGYRFQAGFGIPGHELRFETTTLFFNNEDRGATAPTYTKAQAANNTVMLDSWLSVGAACNGQVGVMKSDDDGVATVINGDGVLQNADTSAGIPLSQQDGMIAGSPEAVVIVGINTEIAALDNQNDGSNGPLFITDNGSWASLNGSTGPDSLTNKVLIAQITTDGTFNFELNIQIGTPTGGVEQYVARNPVGSEIQIPSLLYSSLTTSISKVPGFSPFQVYPNPTSDLLTISSVDAIESGKCKLSIYDISGRAVYNESFISGNTQLLHNVEVIQLSPGIYFLEISSGSQNTVNRFVRK